MTQANLDLSPRGSTPRLSDAVFQQHPSPSSCRHTPPRQERALVDASRGWRTHPAEVGASTSRGEIKTDGRATVSYAAGDRRWGATGPPEAAGVPSRALEESRLWQSAQEARRRNRRCGVTKDDSLAMSQRARSQLAKRGRGGEQASRRVDVMTSSQGGDVYSGREGKRKVDPLRALKDARNMYKKPLIVQWLRSDGYEGDPEVEALLDRHMRLAEIHAYYWGEGGG